MQADGIIEGVGTHDAQDWAEAFVGVVPGSRAHTVPEAGGPEGAFVVELARLDQPGFTGVELGEAAQEFVARGFDHAVHGGGDVHTGANMQGFHGIGELREESFGAAHGPHQDDQRCGGAFLACVPEGGAVDIGDGEVGVGGGSHDDGVFAGGFGVERQLGLPAAEQPRGVGGAGEYHGVHIGVGDEAFARCGFIGVDQLHHVFGDACFTQNLNGDLRTAHHLRCGFDDDGRACRKCCEHAAHGDGEGEVPRRGHNHDFVGCEDGGVEPVECAR